MHIVMLTHTLMHVHVCTGVSSSCAYVYTHSQHTLLQRKYMHMSHTNIHINTHEHTSKIMLRMEPLEGRVCKKEKERARERERSREIDLNLKQMYLHVLIYLYHTVDSGY